MKKFIKYTKNAVLLYLFLMVLSVGAQQSVIGNFPALANQEVRLVGFNGFDSYTIDSTTVSPLGDFKLKYTQINQGMGYLSVADNSPYVVVLSGEDIQLQGKLLSAPEDIVTLSGKDNKLFAQYAQEHPKREQALHAWRYLKKIYETDSLFSTQKASQQAITTEMQRIKQSDSNFLKKINPKSYLSWYLPIRKLVSSVATVVKYRPEDIPSTVTAFRALDYSDERLYKSGLLKETIENQFWLLENMGQPLDTVYKEISKSIDSILVSLSNDETKFNDITKYLFNLLERQSLLQASEYLALKVLTQNSCTVNDTLAKQLEAYRAMKKGNTAPDIVFSGDVYKSGSIIKTPNRVSEIQSKYKVVIFGASWCQKCAEELGQLLPLYEKWKSKGVEVVFVSLNTDTKAFQSFSSILPFISTCDYKKWNTQAVQDYYVFATPTLFLLDSNHKIILRPNSVKQLDTWVDYYIKQDKPIKKEK